MVPAIVLGAHVMGLAVIRALGTMDVPIVVVVYDEKEEFGYRSKYVREKISSPHPERCEAEFLDLLVRCGKRLRGSLLIPTTDETLVTVSRHKALLEQFYTVACTEWDITEKFINKKYTYALAQSIGVPIPKTTVPHSREDVERYGESIEYPCLVKPCESHLYFDRFKRKMTQTENLQQLIAAYQEAADAGLEILLQEWIPGEDTKGVNYNSYFWRGEPLVEFTAEKVRNAPPQFGSPRVAISKYMPEVIELGRKIMGAIGFDGFSCTEFKKDARDGMYKIMDINGRHNRSGMLALYCGINFPWIQYNHLVCGILPSPCDFRTGVYWIDLYRDIVYTFQFYRSEGYSLPQYLKPYFSPHVFAILDGRDLRPFIQRGLNLTKRLH